MLVVNVNKRTTLYVEIIPDTIPNKNGYYCQVYADKEKELFIDDFTLDKGLFYRADGEDANMRKAMRIASIKAKDLCCA